MSAAEIIEQIKALPAKERTQVVDFVKELDSPAKEIRFATPEQAKEAGDKIFQQYDALFRKLAENGD